MRGNNRRVLFSSPRDYDQFLFFAVRTKDKVPVDIHAATLMSNHVHLVVRPPDADALPDFMQRLGQRYAQYRNEQRGGTGKLFERAYHSVPIVDERQLALTLAYVDLNVIRKSIPARSPKHRWTTYWNHVGAPKPAISTRLWTPCEWYLELGSSEAERAYRYAEWIRYCLESGERPDDVDALEVVESLSSPLRVRRPDGTRAT